MAGNFSSLTWRAVPSVCVITFLSRSLRRHVGPKSITSKCSLARAGQKTRRTVLHHNAEFFRQRSRHILVLSSTNFDKDVESQTSNIRA